MNLTRNKYFQFGRVENPDERFIRYTMPEPNTGCWLWCGSLTGAFNYGVFYSQKKGRMLAHRYSYELHKGSIPDGLCIMHMCDNPICVNPDHLKPGTRSENSIDKVNKNRQAKGEMYRNAKISDEDAYDIKRLYLAGMHRDYISKLYCIKSEKITKILGGKTFKHV